MRVVICLQERIDPAAARALARLLFSKAQPDGRDLDDGGRAPDDPAAATVEGPVAQGGGRR